MITKLSRGAVWVSIAVSLAAVHTVPAAEGLLMAKLAGQTVAVVVYPQNAAAAPLKKNALSRLETILTDNDVTVMDQEKADALKNVFKKLDDPGAFVTAEDFVANAGKLDIQGLAAIYLSVDVVPGLADYFTATAHADIRFISEGDAKVVALTTTPMGSPGRPPSDGLTQNSAVINAVQRAIDDACTKMGLKILEPAMPRSVLLTLHGPVPVPAVALPARSVENDAALARLAKLDNQTWRKEKATCTAKAPAGALGAVGGLVTDTDMQRRPPRIDGSRIHLVDTEAKKETMTLDCHSVEKKTTTERGAKQILDALFIKSWRYLSAVTGNSVFLWDTERGQLMAEVPVSLALKTATLHFVTTAEGSFLVVNGGPRTQAAYRLVRQQ